MSSEPLFAGVADDAHAKTIVDHIMGETIPERYYDGISWDRANPDRERNTRIVYRLDGSFMLKWPMCQNWESSGVTAEEIAADPLHEYQHPREAKHTVEYSSYWKRLTADEKMRIRGLLPA